MKFIYHSTSLGKFHCSACDVKRGNDYDIRLCIMELLDCLRLFRDRVHPSKIKFSNVLVSKVGS